MHDAQHVTTNFELGVVGGSSDLDPATGSNIELGRGGKGTFPILLKFFSRGVDRPDRRHKNKGDKGDACGTWN
jgi:hypothetical protein